MAFLTVSEIDREISASFSCTDVGSVAPLRPTRTESKGETFVVLFCNVSDFQSTLVKFLYKPCYTIFSLEHFGYICENRCS